MSNSRTVLPALRSIGAVFLTVFAGLFAFATILSFSLKSTITDKSSYVTAVRNAAFVERMTTYLRNELESECLFYDLPFSVLDEALDPEQLTAFVAEYTGNVYDTLLNGKPLETPPWSPNPFIDAVQNFFNALPPEEKPLDTAAATTVGTELSDYAVAVLEGGIRQSYLEKGHQFLSRSVVTHFLSNTLLFGGAALACAIGAILCNRQGRRRGLCTLFFAWGLSSFAATVPFWLLSRYGVTERIALADSSLKLYVEAIFNHLLHKMMIVTGVVFLAITVLFLVALVFNCIPFAQCKCTQNIHIDGIDEQR